MSPAKKTTSRKATAKASPRGAGKPKAKAAAKPSAKKKSAAAKSKAPKKAASKPSPAKKVAAKKAGKSTKTAKTVKGTKASKPVKPTKASKSSKSSKPIKATKPAQAAAKKKAAAPKTGAVKAADKKPVAKAAGKKAAAKKPVAKKESKKAVAKKSTKAAAVAPVSYLRTTAESVSTHPRLGKKFECFECDAKFYDLNKPDPVCPKCSADQRNKPLGPPKDSTPAKKKTGGRRSRASRSMAPLLDDDDGPANPEDDSGLGRKKVKAGEDYFDNAETISEEDSDEATEEADAST